MTRVLPLLLLLACAGPSEYHRGLPDPGVCHDCGRPLPEDERVDRFDAAPEGELYHLTALPEEGTLRVRASYDGVWFLFEQDVDFVYDPVPNAVEFLEYIPSPGSEIRVEYQPLEQ